MRRNEEVADYEVRFFFFFLGRIEGGDGEEGPVVGGKG